MRQLRTAWPGRWPSVRSRAYKAGQQSDTKTSFEPRPAVVVVVCVQGG